jgi:hypothetical protein
MRTGVGGDPAKIFASSGANGSTCTFDLTGLDRHASCEVSAVIQVSREGTLDPSFARSFVYGDEGPPHDAGFRALQVRQVTTQLVER